MAKSIKKPVTYTTQDDPLPLMEEAAVKYETLNVILGGKQNLRKSISRDVDLINLTREGVKKSTLKTLAAYLGITMEMMSGLLHTSYRNIQRKDDDSRLDTLKTERVLELASFTQRGIEVIGTKDAFAEWIQSPLIALGNKKPLDFLDTSFGIQLLTKMLGRIEQGVFS
jgi:putative toxin-antitoxin system antitoxin component (TIGR02293 family)